MKNDERKRMIADAAKSVKKTYPGTIIGTGATEMEFPNLFVSTGSFALDRLCAGRNPGGVPIGDKKGRIVHIAGEWSTGKSLILDHMFLDCIVRLDGIAFCSETEGTRDPHFANAIGLPLDLLVLNRPDTIEKAFDIFFEWHERIRKVDEERPILWGIDSLDSTIAEKSANAGMTESGGWHYGGGAAEAFGEGLRRMAALVSRYPTSLVMLNQTRDNVGVMFGPKKRTGRGNPPHFYATLELMLSGSSRPGKGYVRSQLEMPALTGETIKKYGLYDLKKGAVVGRYIKAHCTKTKMSTTLDSTAEFYIDFRRGVYPWEGLIERLVAEGRVTSNENLTEFAMNGKEFDSRKALITYLAENMETLAEGPKEDLTEPADAMAQETEE
jgi:RecA/RadA recombinase